VVEAKLFMSRMHSADKFRIYALVAENSVASRRHLVPLIRSRRGHIVL